MMRQLTLVQKGLLLAVLGLIFFYSFNAIQESDSFYHLKTGQVIWESKSVPHSDIFSLTAPGAPWVTHEWLAELLFYAVFQIFSPWGLLTLVALLAAATYYLIFRTAMRRGADFYVTLLFLFVLGYITFELWVARPQTIAYLLLVLLIYAMEGFRHESRPRTLMLAVLIMWLWANINASFVLGLVILLFYFLVECAKSFTSIFGEPSKKHKAWLGFAFLAAVAIAFINPNGYKIFTYSFAVAPSAQLLQIQEWKPLTTLLYHFNNQFVLVEIALVTLLLAWWYGWRQQSRDLTWLGVVVGVSILPFISIRHIGFWPLVAIAPAAVAISQVLKKVLERIPKVRFEATFGIVVGVIAIIRLLTIPGGWVRADVLPVDASDFIEKNSIHGPFVNLYNEGGYLLWRFFPKERVFIDGRSEVYGPTQVNELFDILGGHDNWQQLVDEKYKINYFILAYRPVSLYQSIRPLIVNLMKDNWALIYWDDTSVIYVRNTSENLPLIQKYGLAHVSPFRDPSTIPQSEVAAAAVELTSLLERSSHVQTVHYYTSIFVQEKNIPIPRGEPL